MTTELVMIDDGATPKGYANGRIGHGPALHVAGQVGWNAECKFDAKDLVGQFAQALDNVLVVLKVAHAHPDDVAEMTIYVTDIVAYREARKLLGPIWRARMGTHYPAMALVGVAALVEPEALVEIQAVAYLEHPL